MFTTTEEAKAAGWFSRRHRTDEAHRAAKEAREKRHAAKMERARKQHAPRGAMLDVVIGMEMTR